MKKEIKPVVLEKHEFQIQIEPILQKTLAFIVPPDSNTGTELQVFWPNTTPKQKHIDCELVGRDQVCSFGDTVKPVIEGHL